MASSSRDSQFVTPSPSAFLPYNHPREKLDPGHSCVGCIVWLPPLDPRQKGVYCSKDGCGREKMDAGGYDHPVVILKIRQREDSENVGDLICTVALLSTFQNTTLKAYKKKKRHVPHWQESIPVQMSSPTDKHSTTPFVANPNFLQLESKGMKKQGYVRYDHTFDIPISQLRTYRYRNSQVYHFRLAQGSYEILMSKLEMSVEVFDDTATLFETAKRRLAVLAATHVSARIRQQRHAAALAIANERQPLLPDPYRLPSSSTQEPTRYGASSRTAESSTRIVAPPYQQQRLPVYVRRFTPRVPEPERASEKGWGFVVFSIAVLTTVGFLAGWYFC